MDRKQLGAGLTFVGIALFFGIGALTLKLGTPVRMGPGFFPLALSVVLGFLGTLVLARSVGGAAERITMLSLRGLLLVLATPIVFAATVRGLGMVPSIAVVVLLSALASTQMKPVTAIALAAALTLFCTAVFVWGLGLPLRLFGPWLGA